EVLMAGMRIFSWARRVSTSMESPPCKREGSILSWSELYHRLFGYARKNRVVLARGVALTVAAAEVVPVVRPVPAHRPRVPGASRHLGGSRGDVRGDGRKEYSR